MNKGPAKVLCSVISLCALCGKKGAYMRVSLVFLAIGLVLLAAGCTMTPDKDRPKIYCPACGTELDSIYHMNF